MLLDILGVIGVLLVLIDYFLLQAEKIHSNQLVYPLLNLVGGVLITVSLFKDWNLAAFFMEASWVAVSAWGVWHVIQKKKREKKNGPGI